MNKKFEFHFKQKDKKGPIHAYWFFGGIASVTANVITHPFDLLRLQMQSKVEMISAREVVRQVLKYRGICGLYF